MDGIDDSLYYNCSKKKEKIIFGKVKNKLGDNIQVDSVIFLMSFDSNGIPIKHYKVVNDSSIHIKDRTGYSFFNNVTETDLIKPKKEFEFINQKFANINYELIEKYSTKYSSYWTGSKPQLRIFVKNKLNDFRKSIEVYNLYKYGCIRQEDSNPIELKIFMSYLDNITLFTK